MRKVSKSELQYLLPLCENKSDTLILSCLQGHMGNAWVDRLPNPKSARIITADFCYFIGESNASGAKELVDSLATDCQSRFILVIPEHEGFCKLIESVYEGKLHKHDRYSFKKGIHHFDKQKLLDNVDSLASEYKIVPIEEHLYDLTKTENWAFDLCSNFNNYEDYKTRGIGYAVLHNGNLVCGASSYTIYNDGIEIEIDTREDYRRKGLATACASKLILNCLEKGLFPSWDAANKGSKALAEKLGYIFDEEYITYSMTF